MRLTVACFVLFLAPSVTATDLKEKDAGLHGRIANHITCFQKFDAKRADKLKQLRDGGKLCHGEPKHGEDETAGSYDPKTGTVTLVPHNIGVGMERDNPAFEKVVVYEETQHATQDTAAFERWLKVDE